MTRLVIACGLALARVGLLMRCGHLRSIHSLLRKERRGEVTRQRGATVEQICHAMDIAFSRFSSEESSAAYNELRGRPLFYWAATTVAGRDGDRNTNPFHFRSHAWVELDGVKLANDKSYLARDLSADGALLAEAE